MKEKRVCEDPAKQVNLALWMYSGVVVLTTVFAWFVYLTHQRHWYLRPLFDSSDRYHDLTNYYQKIQHLHDGAAMLATGLPVYNYEAPMAFVYRFVMFDLGGNYVHWYLGILAVFAAALALLAWIASEAWRRSRHGVAAAILTTLVLGYPLWFVMDRGNTEGFVWAFSATGLCLLLRRRTWAAAALLGAATALKPFPVLFFLLFLWHKRFKEIAVGAAVAIVLVISALWTLGPNPWQAYNDLKPGLAVYMNHYIDHIVPPGEMRFDHSLLDGLKSAAVIHENRSLDPMTTEETFNRWSTTPGGFDKVASLVRWYVPMTLVGLGLVFFFFARMPLSNQVTAVGVVVTLFPLSSADYTLLHLYVPFGCFVIFAAREVATGTAEFSERALFTIAAIYALLFAPLTFLKLYAGDAKMLLLIALLAAVARWPMRSRYFGDVEIINSSLRFEAP